ncbi:MAG: hypothetical protein WBD34_10240 [Burkholderiaceae bacterium]
MKSIAAILGLLALLLIAAAPLQAQGHTYQTVFEATIDRINLPPNTMLLDDLPAGTKMTGKLSIYTEAKSGLFKGSFGLNTSWALVDLVLTLNGKLNVIFEGGVFSISNGALKVGNSLTDCSFQDRPCNADGTTIKIQPKSASDTLSISSHVPANFILAQREGKSDASMSIDEILADLISASQKGQVRLLVRYVDFTGKPRLSAIFSVSNMQRIRP